MSERYEFIEIKKVGRSKKPGVVVYFTLQEGDYTAIYKSKCNDIAIAAVVALAREKCNYILDQVVPVKVKGGHGPTVVNVTNPKESKYRI